MKLIDAIKNVARPDNKHSWELNPDCDSICESLGVAGIYGYFEDNVTSRFKAYPIFEWICTDEHVGLDALYLDGEPVGCSYRPARKASYEVEWISNETASKVREFLLSIVDRPQFNLMDPDQDIGDDFAVHYVGQNLTKVGTFEGRPVTITGGYDLMRSNIPYGDERYNKFIIDDNGEEKLAEPQQVRFPFNLAKVDVNLGDTPE